MIGSVEELPTRHHFGRKVAQGYLCFKSYNCKYCSIANQISFRQFVFVKPSFIQGFPYFCSFLLQYAYITVMLLINILFCSYQHTQNQVSLKYVLYCIRGLINTFNYYVLPLRKEVVIPMCFTPISYFYNVFV